MKSLLLKITPSFILSGYHLAIATLAAFYYGFPSRKIIVIGVTGTNGKSTTVDFIGRILEEAGYKVGLTSSVNFKIGDREWMNKTGMTMVGRFSLQKMIREMLNAGCKYAVLEVSSEGIKQWRHFGIDFDVAVFTNLEPEHIESHGGFEKYKHAKGILFRNLSKSFKKDISKSLSRPFETLRSPQALEENNAEINAEPRGIKKVSVVNLDDKEAEYFLGFEAEKKWGYSLKISNFSAPEGRDLASGGQLLSLREIPRRGTITNKFSISNFQTIIAENIQDLDDGIKFLVEDTQFNLKFLGEFNIYNALAAICVGLSQGVDLEICKRALEKAKGIPGRMEIIAQEPFKVVVDYAHTPESLAKVYETLGRSKLQNPNNKLICVLGSDGGVRDKWKRPKLGEIAAKYCGKIVLTDVNPFDEDPSQILSDIKSGIKNYLDENLFSIIDRRKAINKALTLAKKGDTVIITGKGCEQWIKGPKGSKIPWDDREVAREEAEKFLISNI